MQQEWCVYSPFQGANIVRWNYCKDGSWETLVERLRREFQETSSNSLYISSFLKNSHSDSDVRP
jgi:hypothetical protein